jgi:DnaJ-class molecular chaperone
VPYPRELEPPALALGNRTNLCPKCGGSGESMVANLGLARVMLKDCQRCLGRGYLGRHPCICRDGNGYYRWTNAGGREIEEPCPVHRREEFLRIMRSRFRTPL